MIPLGDVELQLGETASLDGMAGAGSDGAAVTFAWTVTGRPAGSGATLTAPAAAQTTFTPDVIGEYEITLTVDDGVAISTDTVRVLVEAVVPDLDADVLDAEYSASLDRIVTLSEDASVRVVDPATGDSVRIALPQSGLALSLAPDGTEAIVSHDGSFSRLDLVNARSSLLSRRRRQPDT